MNNRISLLTVLGARKAERKVPVWSLSGESSLLVHSHCFPAVSWWKGLPMSLRCLLQED